MNLFVHVVNWIKCFVFESLVLNVGIKAFWFTKFIYDKVSSFNINWDSCKRKYSKNLLIFRIELIMGSSSKYLK